MGKSGSIFVSATGKTILDCGYDKTYIIAHSAVFEIAFVGEKKVSSLWQWIARTPYFEILIIHVNMRAVEGEEQ